MLQQAECRLSDGPNRAIEKRRHGTTRNAPQFIGRCTPAGGHEAYAVSSRKVQYRNVSVFPASNRRVLQAEPRDPHPPILYVELNPVLERTKSRRWSDDLDPSVRVRTILFRPCVDDGVYNVSDLVRGGEHSSDTLLRPECVFQFGPGCVFEPGRSRSE